MIVIPKYPCYISNANYLCPENATDLSAAVSQDAPAVLEKQGVGSQLAMDKAVDLSPRMVQEPDYKPVITDANLRRRMGRLLKMSVSCALKSIETIPSEDICGVITSTGMGFMKDTINFGNSLFERAEDMLNPSPFMQSTFNTASGYIALIRKIRSYNTTYVQRAEGVVSSLVDAVMLLDENKEKCVLIGAFDEVTPEVDEIRKRLSGNSVKYALGEGASSFVLSGKKSDVQFCGIATGEAVKSSEDLASVFNVKSECANVVKCSSFADETGAFMSMLPVIACRLISRNQLPTGYTLIVDDVNADGTAMLVNKI